jgi:hypothetical protein
VSNFYWSKSASKNVENDCHVAHIGVSTCPIDVMLMSSSTYPTDILLTSIVRTVDFDFEFLPV